MMGMQNPKLPRFRFDWDPITKKLYLVELLAKPVIGHLMFEDIPTPEAAQRTVMFWCGGYLAKERELADPARPKHHRIVAETGIHSLFGVATKE